MHTLVLATLVLALQPNGAAENCSFQTQGRKVSCELTRPAASGTKRPAIILLHGRAGLPLYGPDMRRQARDLAQAGYVVLIPRYFEATADRDAPEVDAKRFAAWSRALGDAVSYVSAMRDVDPERIGVAGVSLGGFLGVSTAQRDPRIRALAVYSAGLSQYDNGRTGALPPTVIIHGGKDTIVPPAQARRVAAILSERGTPHELHVYPEAEHVLQGADWDDAARRVEAFFDRVLPPRPAELSHLRQIIDRRGIKGTVVVYDVRRGEYRAVHAERATLGLIPASTFKVFSSLAALDAGIVWDEQTVLPWDKVRHERTELNQNLDLKRAFALSAVPHFQELVRKLGAERMQAYLDRVGYGNRNRSGGDDTFWLEGGLRISPMEQVQFLARLYRNELPFSAHAMAVTRALMVNAEPGPHVLRAKTGWASTPAGNQTGWWVGWVERGGDVHIFATAIESPSPKDDFGAMRMAITREVLVALGILPAAPGAS